MKPSFKAAIFDLDGTLIDSMGLWEKIDRKFLQKRGIVIPEDYVDMVKTMSFDKASRYTIDRFTLPETAEIVIQEWMEMALFEYAHTIPLKSGVLSYLHFLQEHQIKIGLATTNKAILYEPVLLNNGIHSFFSAFTTLSEVDRDKGHPDIYLLAANKLGIQAEDCIVFEDTLLGVTGAKQAQMTVIGVHDAYSAPDKAQILAQADGYIYDFEQMLTYHQKATDAAGPQ